MELVWAVTGQDADTLFMSLGKPFSFTQFMVEFWEQFLLCSGFAALCLMISLGMFHHPLDPFIPRGDWYVTSPHNIQGSNLTFLSTSKVLLVRFFLLAKEGT